MWRDVDIAYLAGIIDGEGSICIDLQRENPKFNRKHDYYSLRLTVVNTYKPLIEWIVSTFGGTYYTRPGNPGCKTVYIYRIYGHKIAELIEACIPYLIVKKPHAEFVKEFRKTVGKTGNRMVNDELVAQRRELYLAVKAINKLGDHK